VGKTPYLVRRRVAKLVDAAHNAIAAGDAAGAWRSCEAALAEDPESHDAEFLMGLMASDQSRHDIALPHLEHAAALEPKNPVTLAELGRAHHELRNRRQAEEAYRRSLELRPDAYVEINLATLLRDSGRFAEATDAYRRALAFPELDAETRARIERSV
jgi:tetratricopeptide (TPR) repeat protein